MVEEELTSSSPRSTCLILMVKKLGRIEAITVINLTQGSFISYLLSKTNKGEMVGKHLSFEGVQSQRLKPKNRVDTERERMVVCYSRF